MTAALPDPQADPGAFALAVVAEREHWIRIAPTGHLAGGRSEAHALAEVTLWRGVAERHGGVRIEGKRYCPTCRHAPWPCPDLLAVVAACRAYAVETGEHDA